ncbi:Cupredoxin [Cristinia sonorae]|uniref:Cupredoxin n=1 Tax=Cristinia sonorae TaxID=1940300 RepID=A0A8K0XUD9_9AGAR|nr:Cupredoxin [Cristinia sonorae]
MFKLATVFALLPALALASPQYGGGYGSPSTPTSGGSSSSAAPAAAPSAPPSSSTQINVDVGAGGNFVFNPANITAAAGTLVTFFFPDGSVPHSVTQSSFANPCTPLASGFDSGLQNSKQFTINVTDASTPIWFFCKAPAHCGSGMVGSINAPAAGNTFDNFQAAAIKIGANEQTVQDNGFVSGGVGAIATASPAATATSPASPGGSGASGSGTSPSPAPGSSGSDASTLMISSGLGLIVMATVIGLLA